MALVLVISGNDHAAPPNRPAGYVGTRRKNTFMIIGVHRGGWCVEPAG